MRRGLRPPTVVFVGPTLSHATARAALESDVRPPAALGDVHAAVEEGARTIVLIDGYFERVPAVWHKELLFALCQGIAVYGAASMGALRAAELDRFGMIGIGEVYRMFRTGQLDRDDEVAVVHEPGLSGFRPISEALVNIRATLAAAVRDRVLTTDEEELLVRAARDTYYPDRGYERLLLDARSHGMPADRIDRLRNWLPHGAVDQKRADALAVLAAAAAPAPPAGRPFEQTWTWRDLIAVPARTGTRSRPSHEDRHG